MHWKKKEFEEMHFEVFFQFLMKGILVKDLKILGSGFPTVLQIKRRPPNLISYLF
jgi:hypothetical protein